ERVEPLELRGPQMRRRPSAEMELADATAAPEGRRDRRDLPLDPVEVAPVARRIARDDDRAAAEETELAAEGDVDVERERLARPLGRAGERRAEVALAERVAPL